MEEDWGGEEGVRRGTLRERERERESAMASLHDLSWPDGGGGAKETMLSSFVKSVITQTTPNHHTAPYQKPISNPIHNHLTSDKPRSPLSSKPRIREQWQSSLSSLDDYFFPLSIFFFFLKIFGLISFCCRLCFVAWDACNSTILLCERSLPKKEEWICHWLSESCFEFFTRYLLLYIIYLCDCWRKLSGILFAKFGMEVDSSFGRSETDFVDKLFSLQFIFVNTISKWNCPVCAFFFFDTFVRFLSVKNWIYLFFYN